MKILIAAEILPPAAGGPASWLARVVPELERRGHEIKVVAFVQSGVYDAGNFDVAGVEFNQNKLLRWCKYTKLLKKLSVNYDVILALGGVLAGTAAMRAKKKYNIPLILRSPGDFAWERAQENSVEPIWLEDFYNRRFGFYFEFLKKQQIKTARLADQVVVNSFYQADFIKKYWQVPNSKIKVIRNYFKIDNKYKSQREESNSKILFICGRLIKLKGNYKLFSFLGDWLKKNSDWRVVVAGDGPEKPALEKLVDKLSVKNKFSFVGSLPFDKVISFFQKASAYLLYSMHEGSPNTVLEAINLNVPVIASSRGGTTELVKKYPRGHLVNWGDRAELFAALDKLKTSDLQIHWFESEKTSFFVEYGPEKVINQWEEVLTKTVSN